jgi:hypothetical protein
MRHYIDKRLGGAKKFKRSVFVTFADRQNAQDFIAKENVLNADGIELIRKWQTVYIAEKSKE